MFMHTGKATVNQRATRMETQQSSALLTTRIRTRSSDRLKVEAAKNNTVTPETSAGIRRQTSATTLTRSQSSGSSLTRSQAAAAARLASNRKPLNKVTLPDCTF